MSKMLVNQNSITSSFLGFLVLVASDSVARIVTDPKSVSEGVEIDYNHNETIDENDLHTNQTVDETTRYISAPGCPKSIDGFPWVYYNGKCHLAGFQGPCAPGMKLFIDPHSKNDTGICNCDCFEEGWRLDLSYPLEMTYCFNETEGRHYSLHTSTNRCYQLLSQGPCVNGKWFVMDSSEKNSLCEPRKCAASDLGSAPTFFDEETMKCSAVGDECLNKDTNNSQIFLLLHGNWTPQCSIPWAGAAAFAIDGNSCAGGQRYSSILNTCVKSLTLESSVG